MLAVLNHRASAYHELHEARTKLMGMRQTRSGLFIKKRSNPYSCHAILGLLADIAAAKFQELRLLISLDCFEKQLHDEKTIARHHRIWLGSQRQHTEEAKPQPPKKHGQKLDNVTAFLITALWLRSLQKPAV